MKATLAAVTTGDADAAIVYVTDAKAAGNDRASVPIPAWQNVFAIYPIAPDRGVDEPGPRKAFIEYRCHRRARRP